MDHFSNEVSPEHRYKNDLLNELRKQTKLLEQLLEQKEIKQKQKPEQIQQKPKVRARPIAKDTTALSVSKRGKSKNGVT